MMTYLISPEMKILFANVRNLNALKTIVFAVQIIKSVHLNVNAIIVQTNNQNLQSLNNLDLII
mgnify:CR=1 FL=1